jgi:glycosyltransferase involved in cell wall biosynthesis
VTATEAINKVNSAFNRSVVLSHPGCGPFVQHAARGLHEAGLLAEYVTTFHYDDRSALGRFLRLALRARYEDPEKQLARRTITEIPRNLVYGHPLPELLRMLSVEVGPIATDLVWEQTEKWFDRIVARRHLDGTTAIYGYEHACLESFKSQRARGGLCIYEMPIPHHKTTSAILFEEFDRYPETVTKRDLHLRKLAWRRNARKDQELGLADLVIVNSSFTKQSLVDAGISDGRIKVIPLGAPNVGKEIRSQPKSPFIFLSAGTQSVRKGVHYLLQAWRKLRPAGDVELWLIGQMALPGRLLADLPGKVVIRPSVPREELMEIYGRASVLVFPSLCEGFGMVITEAMANGLPVITTNNTGGPAFIQHGRNGFLIPIRDADCLAETMQWCLDRRLDLVEISARASESAAKWQWRDYRAALGNTLTQLLVKSNQVAGEDSALFKTAG